jgi:hypothetical protein
MVDERTKCHDSIRATGNGTKYRSHSRLVTPLTFVGRFTDVSALEWQYDPARKDYTKLTPPLVSIMHVGAKEKPPRYLGGFY